MTNLKKVGLSLLGIVAVAAIYYFTSGSKQLTSQMKAQLNKELATLQTEGFSIEARETGEKKEHFILTLDNPSKAVTFLNTQGAKLSADDLNILKGSKIGVDVTYLANTYSAVSFDIYPIALPTALLSSDIDKEDKKALQKIETLFKKKTFLIHVDVNKLGTAFKGYMKDINELIDKEDNTSLIVSALKFNGELKNDKLSSIKQTFKTFSLSSANHAFNMQMNNIASEYILTGDSRYDYKTHYDIKSMLINVKDLFDLQINNMSGDSTSTVKNNLVSMGAQTKIESILFKEGLKESLLKTLMFNMKADNFNLKALEKLEKLDSENQEEVLAVLKELITHGIHFEIPNFSVKEIVLKNKKLDGFKLSTAFDIDKSLDISMLQQNPMVALNAINANLHLTLSNQLFGFLAQQPQAVLVMMMFQPKDVNGKKVYKIDLKDGSLTVNDKKAI